VLIPKLYPQYWGYFALKYPPNFVAFNAFLTLIAATMKNYLLIRSFTERHYLLAQNIVRIEGESNYSRIFLKDGTSHLIARTLCKVLDSLPDYFMRVHKSSLLNINFVSAIIDRDTVVLTDGSQMRLARRRSSFLRKKLTKNVLKIMA
jgi:DNA-binding LytR/AlgR family response regulator